MGPGWSFGGVLAFEVAKQLTHPGAAATTQPVLGVILLDAPPPINHEPLPPAVIDHVVDRFLPAQHRHTRRELGAQFRTHARLLQHYHPAAADRRRLQSPDDDAREDRRHSRSPWPLPWTCVLIRCTATFDTERLCGVAYPWLSSAAFRDDAAAEWARVAGAEVRVRDLGCDHFGVFESPGTVSCENTQRRHLKQNLPPHEVSPLTVCVLTRSHASLKS